MGKYDQLDLIEWLEAKAARDAAMEQVEKNADEQWKEAARKAVHDTASEMHYFTSDDVVKRIDPNVKTHELRALGPIILAAVRNGMAIKADMPSRPSIRKSLHASPRTIWRSLITQ